MKSLDTLTYSITAHFSDFVECPSANNHSSPCSGRGTCDRNLGRCVCEQGFTLDDCSARGTWHLENGTTTEEDQVSPIEIDQWAFWSFSLPCRGLELQVEMFAEFPENRGAAPVMFIRRGALPLMFAGSSDLYDLFRGMQHHSLRQAIRHNACDHSNCVIRPMMDPELGIDVGTEWSYGWDHFMQEGIYYIGIYNDKHLATANLQRYSLSLSLGGSCVNAAANLMGHSGCGVGFVGNEVP